MPKAKNKKVRKAGMGWLRAYDPDRVDIDRVGLKRLDREPEPPGLILEVGKLVPPASEALPADEFEARIAEYQRRAAAGLPMPLFGREVPAEPDAEDLSGSLVRCWACGAVEGRPGRGGSQWHSRRHRGTVTETYCPGCFDVWGWPEEYAARLHALRYAETLHQK